MHVRVTLQPVDAPPAGSVGHGRLTGGSFHVADPLCAGLEEGLVQELAYQLFLSTCGYDCSPDNLQSIRRHLQVLTARGSPPAVGLLLGHTMCTRSERNSHRRPAWLCQLPPLPGCLCNFQSLALRLRWARRRRAASGIQLDSWGWRASRSARRGGRSCSGWPVRQKGWLRSSPLRAWRLLQRLPPPAAWRPSPRRSLSCFSLMPPRSVLTGPDAA